MGYRLGDVLDTADDRTAYTPLGSSIFKCAGGGQNYVHGGASVQEMLVPVLDVRTQAGHVETQKATVSLLPTPETLMDGKITLKFLQTELVTDTVLPASYEVLPSMRWTIRCPPSGQSGQTRPQAASMRNAAQRLR